MDNLNNHGRKPLNDYHVEKQGGSLWGRLRVYYTPKYGSWLNQAEIEISLISRQCLEDGGSPIWPRPSENRRLGIGK
jgi:hypothetical protein